MSGAQPQQVAGMSRSETPDAVLLSEVVATVDALQT